ncbi:hypothetical protein MJO28_007550, partial [Puccinia striiformis f. sp. tritici]
YRSSLCDTITLATVPVIGGENTKQAQASTDKVFRKETVNIIRTTYKKKIMELMLINLPYLRYYSFHWILSFSSFTSVIYPPSILSQHSWPFPSSVFLKRFSRGPRTALRYIVYPFTFLPIQPFPLKYRITCPVKSNTVSAMYKEMEKSS